MNLTQLKEKEKCRIVGVEGGQDIIRKLEALGIRKGIEVTKISSQIFRGPILVQAGSTNIAIGYSMAKKISVQCEMKKILLIGNPNVGKSVVFSRLTGIDVISSNYPGTTVEFIKGYLRHKDEHYEIIDVPGTYSLEPTAKAEEVAIEMLDDGGDIIVNIIDSTNLERNLNLTLQLLKKKIPMIILLNFWDETKHKGISIDHNKLEEILGVPVIPLCAVTGEGITNTVDRLDAAKVSEFSYDSNEIWQKIGEIIKAVQTLTHKHHTIFDTLSDISIKPLTGIPFALIILFLTFMVVRFIGEGLINYLLDPLFNRIYYPLIIKIAGYIPLDIIRMLLIGKTPVVMESFGFLTTGIYIPFVVVLPYIFSFYFVLSILEDFGYLPRVAVLFDTVFHKLGMHGYSSVPILLGLGCKVPALLATRILESKREKIITIILILMSAPCMPQTAMIFSLGTKYGIKTVLLIFSILLMVAVLTSFILNRILKGEVPELFVEIPPYRIPMLATLSKKLQIRIKGFIKEAIPMIILGIIIINIFDLLGIIDFISKILGKHLMIFLNLPEKIAAVMILGFLRKDVSIAMLAPFNLDSKQFIISSIFLVLYLPCVASFFTLKKEMGFRTTILIVTLTFFSAFSIALLLNYIL
ncbi:MAG: fused ferrous iron transport protein A/B [Elusimicrobia bacterium]|nr:fused ferrous iron transport protein A/B [Elusimicrobiota bacterium]